jgi:dTDP-4-amino-4,6-dideoxygalactose transaminase
VFVGIRSDTFNLDERLVESAFTHRTRAVLAVHYAGVPCEMDALAAICHQRGVMLIEDAAQALLSTYKGRPAGSFGQLAAISFHETKNVMSGEGGALLINDPALAERAEIIWEKGTNRTQFFRGQADKYTWVDVGSSFLPSDLTAAVLWAQLEQAAEITGARKRIWSRYHDALAQVPESLLGRPIIPEACEHNAHLYYLVAPDASTRAGILSSLNAHGIDAVFHYVPLHSSPAGRRFGRVSEPMVETDRAGAGLFRLPLWVGLSDAQSDSVVQAVFEAVSRV